jgi:hypothetical protein
MKRPTEAYRSAELFEIGGGSLVVARFKADGRVEAGFFLLDVYCLGVKDAGFARFDSHAQYERELLERISPHSPPVAMTPGAARRLVEEAVRYAGGLGFAPGADYKLACRVFGGIEPQGEEPLVFGKDGKPFYVQGPSESPERCDRILRTLAARLGEDGFHYLLAPDGSDWSEDADDWEAEEDSGLEAMAARVRAEMPALDIRINRTGDGKVSDMIALVAEPLLEQAPDFSAKRAILSLAALAWNLRLLSAPEQEKMREDIAAGFDGPQTMEIFTYLSERAARLFPEERRMICKLETELARGDDFALRVVTADLDQFPTPQPGAGAK